MAEKIISASKKVRIMQIQNTVSNLSQEVKARQALELWLRTACFHRNLLHPNWSPNKDIVKAEPL